MEVLPHVGGSAFGTLARRLRGGGLVCLVADRDLSASGVEVEFFGETHPDAGRPGAAGPADRRAPAAGHPLVRRLTGHARPGAPAGRGPRAGEPGREDRRDDPARSPTSSPRASPSTPRTGTCSSGCGCPTWNRAAPHRPPPPPRTANPPPERRTREDRDRLPVLLGRPRRRPVPHPRPGRAPDRASATRSPCWPRPTTTPRCRPTWSRPAARCRSRTTARSPG